MDSTSQRVGRAAVLMCRQQHAASGCKQLLQACQSACAQYVMLQDRDAHAAVEASAHGSRALRDRVRGRTGPAHRPVQLPGHAGLDDGGCAGVEHAGRLDQPHGALNICPACWDMTHQAAAH